MGQDGAVRDWLPGKTDQEVRFMDRSLSAVLVLLFLSGPVSRGTGSYLWLAGAFLLTVLWTVVLVFVLARRHGLPFGPTYLDAVLFWRRR